MGNYRTYSIRTHLLAPYMPLASASTLGATASNDAKQDPFHEPYVLKRRVLVPSTSVQSRTAARPPQLANHHALWHHSARAPSVRVHAAQHSVHALQSTLRIVTLFCLQPQRRLCCPPVDRPRESLGKWCQETPATIVRPQTRSIHPPAPPPWFVSRTCAFSPSLCRSRQQASFRSSQ